jgi:xylulokinase
MHFLGIDIGTSAVKAILVDEHQAIVGQTSASIATQQPRPGWSEQNPVDWWRATEHVVAELRTASLSAFADVRAIGLSGQMHGLVALDANHEVIRPAILWNDGRATRECAALAAAVPGLAEIAGVIAMPGFTAPKLLWMRGHEPEAFARIRHVVLAKDYVRLGLTGEVATDMADAAGTLLLDEARRDWSAPVLAAVGLSREQVPRLLEGSAVSGMLRPEIAARWGLTHPVTVVAGGGDSAAGAVGIGAIGEGDSFISLGTSAQIFKARDRYAPKPATLVHAFAHSLPGRWFEQAALLNGASCLEWVARLVGEADIGALLGRVEAGFRGPSPVTFLPYLSGERTPLNDPDARGVFAYLENATGPLDLVQAVLDGVAFSLIDGRFAFGEGIRGDMPMIGGGARSRFWMKIIASALGRPLQRVAHADAGPAFGAARLARLALTGETPEAVCTKPRVEETIDPDSALNRAYDERFHTFRALYRSIRRVREATADPRPAATR